MTTALQQGRGRIIQARQNIRDLEDRLKRLIFLQPGSPRWETQVRPTQPVVWRDVEFNPAAQIVGQRLPRGLFVGAAKSDFDAIDKTQRAFERLDIASAQDQVSRRPEYAMNRIVQARNEDRNVSPRVDNV